MPTPSFYSLRPSVTTSERFERSLDPLPMQESDLRIKLVRDHDWGRSPDSKIRRRMALMDSAWPLRAVGGSLSKVGSSDKHW